VVLKLDLVACDRVNVLVEDEESRRGCSLVYAADEPLLVLSRGVLHCASTLAFTNLSHGGDVTSAYSGWCDVETRDVFPPVVVGGDGRQAGVVLDATARLVLGMLLGAKATAK